ncbi:hypothetical protein AXG93_2415s1690 [Marchantia polymorpha subsp. ruderalis]|uniref:Uncharacterized protein n=1 Tax=Marchantia polymorpha subsp. ruderalis TaxID=1480154 RepID=A0A176VXG4_MARPO|nr:hypothetical protein AXG93_2415s1690 [Marchantia polymorpha subsp. ruderalis]
MLHSSSKRSARPPSPSKYPSEPPPPLRPPPPLAVGVDAALPPLLPPRQGTGTEKLNPHERIERERERGGENGGERMLCQEFGDEVPSTQFFQSWVRKVLVSASSADRIPHCCCDIYIIVESELKFSTPIREETVRLAPASRVFVDSTRRLYVFVVDRSAG